MDIFIDDNASVKEQDMKIVSIITTERIGIMIQSVILLK